MTRKYQSHGATKTAKVRKLIIQGGISVQEIAKTVKVPRQRVYALRSELRKLGQLPEQQLLGIASLPASALPPPEPETFMYEQTKGKQTTAPNTFVKPVVIERVSAVNEVENAIIERKLLKRAYTPVALMTLFLVALLAYTLLK